MQHSNCRRRRRRGDTDGPRSPAAAAGGRRDGAREQQVSHRAVCEVCDPDNRRCYCCQTLNDAPCFWDQKQCWNYCPSRRQQHQLPARRAGGDTVIHHRRAAEEQPRRPSDQQEAGGVQQGAVRYADVFLVSGGLAEKPVAPQDAATMQSAENLVFVLECALPTVCFLILLQTFLISLFIGKMDAKRMTPVLLAVLLAYLVFPGKCTTCSSYHSIIYIFFRKT
ncbi:hypothetical protein BAE44_0007074 [Dichanthelium oligosanthes]|uniref:SMP domain-containing protein n=1 Tax=Dichanthelium oligosanthes TaxID=888268 RepID=A0A1E5W3J7_9POAL|nr:hypothetical protein BAE44_0007074 [Dichanthelium oligosanthes]